MPDSLVGQSETSPRHAAYREMIALYDAGKPMPQVRAAQRRWEELGGGYGWMRRWIIVFRTYSRRVRETVDATSRDNAIAAAERKFRRECPTNNEAVEHVDGVYLVGAVGADGQLTSWGQSGASS